MAEDATTSTQKAADWTTLEPATDTDGKIGGNVVTPFNVKSNAAAGAVTNIVQVVFPTGTTFPSTVGVTYRSQALTSIKAFSSPKYSFKFPTIAGITSNAAGLTEA